MIADIFDLVISTAEIQDGRAIQHVQKRGMSFVVGVDVVHRSSRCYSNWTIEEDEYLKKNLGWISEDEIAANLGRTRISVHLRWKRDLHLVAPSKHPDFITGQQASYLIGIDTHKISHWCDAGLIPFRNMAANRKMRLIYRTTFFRWATTPANWIYFNWREIPDPHLRRLCELRAHRWGDEWMSTAEVGKLHGVTSKDVQRLVYRGELPAVQVSTSLGGRHKDPAWLNWYVKRSDAVKAVFYKGKGSTPGFSFTPRGAAWALKARNELGMTFAAINRSMGSKVSDDPFKKALLRLMS